MGYENKFKRQMGCENKQIASLFYDKISRNTFSLESYNKILKKFLADEYDFDKYLIYWRYQIDLWYENIVNDLVQYYVDEIKEERKLIKVKIDSYNKRIKELDDIVLEYSAINTRLDNIELANELNCIVSNLQQDVAQIGFLIEKIPRNKKERE